VSNYVDHFIAPHCAFVWCWSVLCVVLCCVVLCCVVLCCVVCCLLFLLLGDREYANIFHLL
jgi:hypothetical protein